MSNIDVKSVAKIFIRKYPRKMFKKEIYITPRLTVAESKRISLCKLLNI